MGKMSWIQFVIGVLGLMLLLGCKSQQNTSLQNGDLLFVTAKQEGLSGAINNVTQREEKANFDHIGIVEKSGTNIFVLHAAPKGGSQKQKLNDFLKNAKSQNQTIVQYRLKKEFQKTIPKALVNANSMLGKPYNFNYILDEQSYYCSDFIERIFRADSIFVLEPMTFKDPSTGETNAFWKSFYEKKGLQVPEGELGCNPNGLAASPKLERLEILKY